MRISVIIPTCHRNDLLSKCLERLGPGKQSLPLVQYEVIVSDDGWESTAETLIMDKYPWVKWLKGPRMGPAANRNHAVKYAQGDWIAFTDDDCLPSFYWLESYVNAIEMNPEVQVFEGRTYADRPKKSFLDTAPINERGGHLPSCNFFIHKKCFLRFDGFDEDYKFNFEDMDLHYRLKKQNCKVHFVYEASVCHPWRTVSGKKIWTVFYLQKKGICCFIKKHPDVLRNFNSIHFIREAIKNFMTSTIPYTIAFKGAGVHYEILLRLFEIQMSFVLAPGTITYYIKRLSQKSLSNNI